MATERCPTGVKGFDALVQGGLPRNSTVLLCGTPGCGKTIFALEFLYRGALEFGERGYYLTFEQTEDALREQARQLNFKEFDRLEKQGAITIKHVPVREIDASLTDWLKKECQKLKVKRLVVDSLSTLAINAPIYTPVKDIALVDIMKHNSFFSPPVLGDFVVKRFIYTFVDDLLDYDHTTTLLISEASEKGEYLSRDTISEFVCDGVVMLNFEPMGGQFSRSLLVRKMRHTKHDEDIHPLEVSDNGLVVHSLNQ